MKILIDGRLYDATGLRHPGGRVIGTHAFTDANPIDATNAFEAFHARSERARALLRTMPSIEARADSCDAVDVAHRALVAQLRRDGFFDPSASHVAYRVAMVTSLWLFGATCVRRGTCCCGLPSAAWSVVGVAVLALAYMQCGWVQHECGHKSFTGNVRVDALLQTLFNDVLMGGSHRFWNEQHHSHHANTQNVEHDKDLKTMPLVAFDVELVRRKRHSVFTRHQHWLYWMVINPIVWFVWSFLSYPRHAYVNGYLLSHASTKAVCIATYSTIVWTTHGWMGGVCLFHAVSMLGTMLLLATFTVSHTTTDAYSAHKGWVRPASDHTVNVRGHWLTNWWMGYLNFQIEHHLFPSMPQFRQGVVAEHYTRPFFAMHGLTYVEKGFVRANMDVFDNLKRVSRFRTDKSE